MMFRRFLVLAFSLAALPTVAQQGSPSVQEIIQKLQPAPAGGGERPTLRGIKVEGAPDAPPAAMPSIDLSVNFEFGSARLTTDARIVLDNLGRALSDPSLLPYRFMVAGHTDAKGPAEVNLRLSDARAHSVTDYLTRVHGIAAARLSAKGYGATQLLYKDDPENALNRRVQITTLGPNS